MALVVPYRESIQYDGTNGSYIIDTWLSGSVTLISDTGTTLTWENFEESVNHVDINGWLTKFEVSDQDPQGWSNANYLSQFVELPSPPVLVLASGYALTPNILASASANVAVDLDTTMSGTSYEASAVLAGASSLLGSLAITSVAITDTNTVTVTVQNNGLLALAGATVVVTAGEIT